MFQIGKGIQEVTGFILDISRIYVSIRVSENPSGRPYFQFSLSFSEIPLFVGISFEKIFLLVRTKKSQQIFKNFTAA